MKTYTFELTIEEGHDEFWEDINQNSKSSGVDELIETIKVSMQQYGWEPCDYNLKLKKFEDI